MKYVRYYVNASIIFTCKECVIDVMFVKEDKCDATLVKIDPKRGFVLYLVHVTFNFSKFPYSLLSSFGYLLRKTFFNKSRTRLHDILLNSYQIQSDPMGIIYKVLGK